MNTAPTPFLETVPPASTGTTSFKTGSSGASVTASSTGAASLGTVSSGAAASVTDLAVVTTTGAAKNPKPPSGHKEPDECTDEIPMHPFLAYAKSSQAWGTEGPASPIAGELTRASKTSSEARADGPAASL